MTDKLRRSIGRLANRCVRFADQFRFRRIRRAYHGDSDASARFPDAAARYRTAYDALCEYRSPALQEVTSTAYPWPDWAAGLAKEFSHSVPPDFTQHPTVKETMVFHGRLCNRGRIASVLRVFGHNLTRELLVEDAVGDPSICHAALKTSSNRLYHAFHLAQYKAQTGKDFSGGGMICEWGGGYGDMARLLWRLSLASGGNTIVLIDLPAVGALQWVYLTSILGPEGVVVIKSPGQDILPNCINIMNSCVALAHPGLKPVSFVSTWALSESPHSLQSQVVKRNFFNAANVLLAFSLDGDNKIAIPLQQAGGVVKPVPFLTLDGYAPSSYGFR